MLSKEFSIVKSNLTYAINGLTSNKIKSIIGRERLKHTKKQILNYLYIHVYAIFYKVNYKFIYDKITNKDKTLSETLNSGNFDIKINITVRYSTFMHNLNLYAILFKYVFVFNRNYILSLLFSKNNYLIIDSTLINTKKNIVGSDYKKKNVTIRNKKSICGFKLFSATNKHNKILFVNIENINYSDYNFLKNIEFRSKQLNFDDYEYLLVDRGFNSKKVTNLIKKHTNIGLISPNKGKLAKIKQFNSDFEQEIYKNRWTIEKIFKLIKNNRGVYDLEFIAKGNVSFNLKKSLTYLVCLMYNLEI